MKANSFIPLLRSHLTSVSVIVLMTLLSACSAQSAGGIPASGGTQAKSAASPSTVATTATIIPPAHIAASPSAIAASVTIPAVSPTAPAPTATPTPNFTHPGIIVLASNLPEPDDLLVGPDGTVYISDVQDGTVRRITRDGKLELFLSGLNEPEGMVLLPEGSMILVEQGKNRLMRVASSAVSAGGAAAQAAVPLRDLSNPSGRLGVDGIALDARPGVPPALIIPDSPNDRLLRMSLDGRSITVITRGLIRPTAAWLEADGSILVVEENGGRLDRVRPDGSVEKLASLPTPDDVVKDLAGNIFVTTLGDGAVHWIDGKTMRDHILLSGLSSPQGLALDRAGNLLVTDPGNHRVVKIQIYP